MTAEAPPEIEQLEELASKPLPRTLLETWYLVLGTAEEVMLAPIGPEWADGLTRLHPKLEYSELDLYVEHFMEYYVAMRDILENEIGNDTERRRIFARTKTDAKMNGDHYLNILLLWQQQINVFEREWDHQDPRASVKAAALLDVAGMFFGNTRREGFVAHLDHPAYAEIRQERAWLDGLLREWQKEEL